MIPDEMSRGLAPFLLRSKTFAGSISTSTVNNALAARPYMSNTLPTVRAKALVVAQYDPRPNQGSSVLATRQSVVRLLAIARMLGYRALRTETIPPDHPGGSRASRPRRSGRHSAGTSMTPAGGRHRTRPTGRRSRTTGP